MLRFDQLQSVNVEIWPTRVGQCWGLTDSSRSMLRFGQLESVNVEVWPTRVGQCWGMTNSSQSMLRYDRLESVNVEVWPTRIVLLNKILALAIFDGPTQSGFDQLSQDLTNSVSNIGSGGGDPPPPWSHPWLLLKIPMHYRLQTILNPPTINNLSSQFATSPDWEAKYLYGIPFNNNVNQQ